MTHGHDGFTFHPRLLAEWREQGQREEFTPRDAWILVSRLGGLAVWLLADEVLQRAADHCRRRGMEPETERLLNPPPPPRERGTCNVLCAQAEADSSQPAWPLREGFILPLQWRRRKNKALDGTRRLPESLRELAGDVLLRMHAYRSGGSRSTVGDWELVLNVDHEPDRYDLSGWTENDFPAGSGWAALAAGWLLAERGGLQDATAAASAAWKDGQGLVPVTRLAAKADACRRHGVQTLFVASGQPGLDTLPMPYQLLPAGQENPLESLRPLLRRLLVPPAENAGLIERSHYYQDLRTVLNLEEDSRRYYVEHLLPEVAEDCRGELPESARHLIGNCRVVTQVSWSAELVELTAAVLQPVECLPLCTEQTERDLQQVRQRLAESLPGCRVLDPVLIPNEVRESLDEIAGLEPLAEFVRRDPDRTVIDLKPGSKTVTAALELLARRQGAWAYILQNVQAGLRDIQPGRESPFLYRPV